MSFAIWNSHREQDLGHSLFPPLFFFSLSWNPNIQTLPELCVHYSFLLFHNSSFHDELFPMSSGDGGGGKEEEEEKKVGKKNPEQ